MKNIFRKIVWVFLALVIAQAACSFGLPGSAGTASPTALAPATSVPVINPVDTPTPLLPPPPGIYPPAFAKYNEAAVSLPGTFNGGGYSLPLDLSQVQGLDQVTLSDSQQAQLAQNGFTVATPDPGKFREFYQIYEQNRYMETPVFITTDSIFHVYHLIFDKMLRDLETGYFITDIKSLSATMLAASTSQYQSLQGSALEDPALRNAAYFGVTDRLLGLSDPIPPAAQSLVDAELALINAASGAAVSPIWDRSDLAEDEKLIEDYSQYVPRGHYTRSEDLKMYFKAMMWYGRLTFRLKDSFETQRALLLVQAARSATAADGTPALDLWHNVYDPTVFIVGKADDLGISEYGALSDEIFGQDPDPSKFADATLFASFMQASETLPPPQVNSMWVWIWQDPEQVTKGFRFMGQRFTLDAYVFGQVIWRKVGTPDLVRGLPKGLDFFAAMGSEEAANILNEMGENKYANFDTQSAKVRSQVAALGLDSWTQNLYWSWLYAFQPLISPKDASFPPFMQTQAWTRKDLQTALGSWTELKHDTILYAKQVMAEMGGGAPEQEPPHGYVEPNPEAYARLLALAQMTYDGLQSRNLLSDLTRGNLENLISTLEFLQDISQRELSGEPITSEEYWQMTYWGGTLEQFTLKAADTTGDDSRDLSDQKAALVADVATGTYDLGSLVALEEGVGEPTPIYVVLPDSPWRVAVGAVYTYYEFTVPVSERMTDEAWQAQVQAGTNPAQPDWTQMFIAP